MTQAKQENGKGSAPASNPAVMKAYAELQMSAAKKDLLIEDQAATIEELEREKHALEQRISTGSTSPDAAPPASSKAASNGAEVERLITTWRAQLTASQNRCDSLMRQLHKERVKVLDLEKRQSVTSLVPTGDTGSAGAAEGNEHTAMLEELYRAMQRMQEEHEGEVASLQEALVAATTHARVS